MRRLCLAVLLCLSIAPLAAAKEYEADRFDARIEVLEGGDLRVTETIVFRFTEGTFTYVFRTIPTRRTDGIEFQRASMDGVPMPVGDGPGRVRLRRKNGLRIEWHFAPVSPGVHTFELAYIARGVVRQAERGDWLAWRALPSEHDYRIAASRVEVAAPASPVRQPELAARRVDGDAALVVEGSSVIVDATRLRRNGWLEVSVLYPASSVLDGPPAWQARQLAHRAHMPLWLGVASLVLLAGLVLLFAQRQNYDRPPADVGVQWSSMIPPEPDLAPAMAGALASNGQPKLEHAMGAMLSMAERGLLTIREEPKKRWGQRSFVVEQARAAAGLAPHEEEVLSILFTHKGSAERTVSLSKTRSRLVQHFSRFRRALTGELAAAGLLDASRQASRRRSMTTGIVLLVVAGLAMGGALFLIDTYGGWPMLVALALALTGLTSFILVGTQTPLSNDGVRRGEQWRAFRKHLSDPQAIEPRWGASGSAEARMLPLAVALGLAAAWSKYMKKRRIQTPAWFHAASSLDDGYAFAAFVGYSGASAHGGGSGASAGAAGGGASGAG